MTHCSRAFGMQLPLADADTIRVVDARHQEIAVLDGHLVRQILEHHLAVVALHHALAVVVERPLTTPYRKALGRLPFTTETKTRLAVARRSRKRPG